MKRIEARIFELLDRPRGRGILGWIGSVYGRRCIPGFHVYEEDGIWIHQYPGPRYAAHERMRIPRRPAGAEGNEAMRTKQDVIGFL